MKTANKLVMFIYLLILTGLLGIFLIIPFGIFSYDTELTFVNSILNDYKWYCFAAALIVILLNIKLLYDLVIEDNIKKIGVVKYTSEGELNISFETIKALVVRTASQAKGIKEIKVMLRPGRDNINIMIKVLIFPDINIPETVKAMQENVKTYVEAMTEIPVGEVKVMVTDIASSTKLRLE